MTISARKNHLRRELLAARRAVTDETSRSQTSALCSHARGQVSPDEAVAAYIPVRGEPGFPALADELADACARVLVPIARPGADGVPQPLHWADYHGGELVDAPYGLREPAGPRLPPSALGGVRTVFVPALAVDRRGVRLGRGAGFYDRSLRYCDPACRRIAVVRDDELVAGLPAGPHDVPMTHALTPARGLVALS